MKSQVFIMLLAAHYVFSENDTTTYQQQEYSNRPEMSEEKRLAKDLLRLYKRSGTVGRPVRNSSTQVTVEFGLGLLKMDILEKENLLTMSVWSRFKWTDEYLQWDPSEYGDIDAVKLPSHRLWRPDIELYNTASTERFEREVLSVVRYDGTVTWFPHRMFQSSCSINVRNFPFDNQTCNLWFGSWTHSKPEMDLKLAFPQGIDLSTFQADFKETSKWDIVRVIAGKLPEAEAGNFAVLTFVLHLQRRLTFSSYILTLPVVFMSFLTLLVFWLPAESADKSNVGLTIFGSLLLLLLILLEAAPPTASAVPMLGIYYCFNIVIVMLSIFLSSVVSKLVAETNAYRIRKRPPPWMRKIFFGCLTPAFCMSKPFVEENSQSKAFYIYDEEKENLLSCLNSVGVFKVNGSSRMPSEHLTNLYNTINMLCHTLNKYIVSKGEEDGKDFERKLIKEEWRCVAALLDRLFLITYLTVILISLVLMFPR